eukprot:6481160-Amphidinium_carterae.1
MSHYVLQYSRKISEFHVTDLYTHVPSQHKCFFGEQQQRAANTSALNVTTRVQKQGLTLLEMQWQWPEARNTQQEK